MKHPKIISAKAIDGKTLLIEFDNSVCKVYDIAKLLQKEMFMPLNNYAFFRNVQVEKNGYAVFWNEDIDISEHELWVNGQEIELSL